VRWFTVQGGNFVGRIDPTAGRVDLEEAPTPKSRLYGTVVDSKGVPWFVLFRGSAELWRRSVTGREVAQASGTGLGRPRGLARRRCLRRATASP